MLSKKGKFGPGVIGHGLPWRKLLFEEGRSEENNVGSNKVESIEP